MFLTMDVSDDEEQQRARYIPEVESHFHSRLRHRGGHRASASSATSAELPLQYDVRRHIITGATRLSGIPLLNLSLPLWGSNVEVENSTSNCHLQR